MVTEYLIDPQNHTGYAKPIEEHVGGNLDRTYTIGHEIITQADHGTGTVLHFLHDGHGSTRALVNGSAAVVEPYSYDAFGQPIGFNPATAATTWLFGGDGQYDPASDLTNHIDRWRQGHLFLSLDRFAGDSQDPLSLHKYLYVHADPVQGIDPSGLFTMIGLGSANAIGNSLNSIEAQTGQNVAEIALAVAKGLSVQSAIIGVVASELLGAGVPVLSQSIGKFFTVLSSNSSALLGRFLPRLNGNQLLPGILHVNGSQLELLFKKGAASVGSSTELRRQYANLIGVSSSSLEGIGAQFHHLIPVRVWEQSSFLKQIGFQIDSALNALPLRVTRHAGRHQSYNDAMELVVNEIATMSVSDPRKRELLLGAITNAASKILDGNTLRRSSLSADEWVRAIRPF